MRQFATVCLLALLAACGGPPAGERPDHCDAQVLGTCVVSDRPVDAAHVERALRLALGYWNAPEGAAAGWAFVFVTGETTCNGAPASGCTHLDGSRTVTMQVLDPDCIETAQLVHELGHVLHGDPDHRGPWWSWSGEQTETWRVVRSPGASPGCATSAYYVRPP